MRIHHTPREAGAEVGLPHPDRRDGRSGWPVGVARYGNQAEDEAAVMNRPLLNRSLT